MHMHEAKLPEERNEQIARFAAPTPRTLSQARFVNDRSNWSGRFVRSLREVGMSIASPKPGAWDRFIGQACGYGLVAMLSAGAVFLLHRPAPLYADVRPMLVSATPTAEALGCPAKTQGLSEHIFVSARVLSDGTLTRVQCARIRVHDGRMPKPVM